MFSRYDWIIYNFIALFGVLVKLNQTVYTNKLLFWELENKLFADMTKDWKHLLMIPGLPFIANQLIDGQLNLHKL